MLNFRAVRSERRKGSEGFSLIEILVVIALIAIISLVALPSVSSYFQASLNSASREISSTFKEAYNSAMVTGKVHRMAYDIKTGDFWVESGPADVLLDTKESKERAERRKRFGSILEEAKPASVFTQEKTITRKKLSLPRGVGFEDVVTQESKEPIVDGTAYTHIFPHGLTERTIIHLVDSAKHKVSLVLTPISGQTDMYGRYVTEEEIFGK